MRAASFAKEMRGALPGLPSCPRRRPLRCPLLQQGAAAEEDGDGGVGRVRVCDGLALALDVGSSSKSPLVKT